MKISKDLSGGTLHPREVLFTTGSLGALNAELQVAADGANTVALDLRTGAFNGTVQVQGTVDGVNWTLIPIRPQSGSIYVNSVVTTTTQAGVWVASCAGYRLVRVIVTAFTSGAITAYIATSTGSLDTVLAAVTPNLTTAVGASGAAVTLTLTAPGVGLRHYLTYLRIVRFATALLTAAATPVTLTTTNLPGSLAFTFPAEAATQGSVFTYQEDFAYPVAASVQNTATTIVAPATTGVIWRITGGFYVAP